MNIIPVYNSLESPMFENKLCYCYINNCNTADVILIRDLERGVDI